MQGAITTIIAIMVILFSTSCTEPETTNHENDNPADTTKEQYDFFTFGSKYVRANGRDRYCKILTEVIGTDSLSIYGGWLEVNQGGTGFFRVAMYEGRWWFVDPEGYLFISMGLNSVRPNTNDDSPSIMAQKFGDIYGWGESEADNLRFAKLNTLGSWSDWEYLRNASQPVPYTRRWNFLTTYDNTRSGTSWTITGVLPVFDQAFPTFCDQHAQQLNETAHDPWLLGHWADNELSFYANTRYGGMLERYLGLPTNDENYQYTHQWMIDRKGVNYQNNITSQDEADFQEHVVETYYRIVSEAIKKYDPNHLFLGTRFHGAAKDQANVVRAAGEFVDVISYNYYGDWEPQSNHINMWLVESGRPFIISEFYIKGDDTGMSNTSGAGWRVPTQEDRGLFYQNWTLVLLEHPGAIGWHWHRYQDYDDGTDSNKGMVDNNFEWYTEMVNATRLIGQRVYSLTMHLAGF